MSVVCINGKFTAQRTTGVQRVASRLVQALDAMAEPGRYELLCPPAGQAPPLRHIAVRRVAGPGGSLHGWEQVALPRAARARRLLNLSGSAPWFSGRAWAMLHDAAVFDHPEAYTTAFVAWYRALFRRLSRRAERLFTVSAFSRERLAWHLRVPASRFTLLPNGCDHLDAIAPDDGVLAQHGLHGTRFLLAVASANPTKNLAALLAAYARLPPAADLRLVIVGGSNARVFSGTQANDDPAGVVRTGPLDDAPLKALYRHAQALVFPSLYEGFGLPPLEAMACGCPVLAARAASLPEVCGDAALYCDPRSVDDIAAGMQRLLHDADLREQLREAGGIRACAFRWSQSAAVLHAALHPEGSA